MFSKKFWCQVPISRGGANGRIISPADAHGGKRTAPGNNEFKGIYQICTNHSAIISHKRYNDFYFLAVIRCCDMKALKALCGATFTRYEVT